MPKPQTRLYETVVLFRLAMAIITLQEEIECSVNQHNKQEQYKGNGEQSVSLQAAGA